MATGASDEFAGTGAGDDGGPSSIDPATLGGTGAADSGDGFDPAVHISRDSRNADGSYRRKRARKGSGAGKAQTSGDLKQAIDSLASMIGIVHIGIAAVARAPEMQLADEESKAIASSLANVMKEFDMTPDPKVTAVVGLVTTMGMVYGPRGYLIRSRVAEEKARNNANVVTFPGA